MFPYFIRTILGRQWKQTSSLKIDHSNLAKLTEVLITSSFTQNYQSLSQTHNLNVHFGHSSSRLN